jgi:integrase
MTGTKTQIAPGVWRLRVFVGRNAKGHPIQRSKTIRVDGTGPNAGVRKANEELAKMVADVARGNRASGTETVGELLDRFLDHSASLGRSPTTLRKYHQIADAVVRPELGRIKLSKLSAQDLDRLYGALTAKGNKATTVRRVHALVGAALHQAEKWDLIDRNVSLKASPPPVHKAEIAAPEPGDVVKLIRAAEEIEPTMAALFTLAALTGARRGELCALRWSDLDMQEGTLRFARSIYETHKDGGWDEKPTKTHGVRRVGLDEVAIAVIEKHQARVLDLADDLGVTVAPDAFMFSRSPAGAEPIRPDLVTGFMKRVTKKAGVPAHVHQLRHFTATQAIAAGYDVATVAERLGHADPSVTLRTYSHALKARDRELAATLGRTLELPK